MLAYIKFIFFVFFPVSENGGNGLGDEGADGSNAPQNFRARTAPGVLLRVTLIFIRMQLSAVKILQCNTSKYNS